MFVLLSCDESTDAPSSIALAGTVTINNVSPKVGDILTATYSGGNVTGSATWQWLRNDTVISGANSSKYTIVTADLGTMLKAQVSYSNQSGSITSNATNAVAAAAPQNLTGTVTINNVSPKVGDILTATYSGGNGTGTAAWQWLRGNYQIPGANSSTYTVVASDYYTSLRVEVSFANQSGYIYSDSTNTVAAAILPNLAGTVTINNMSPRVGDTLTATYSDGNGTGTATWQWSRNDAVIYNSNSSTHTVVAADLGTTLKAQVSYSNQSGNVTSTATNAVAAATPPNLTGTVTINNMSPKVGDILTATYSGGNGSGTATWQWLRNDSVISGANSSVYTVVAADLGAALKAQVSYANQIGNASSTATGTVAAATPPNLTGTVTIRSSSQGLGDNTFTPIVGDTLTATYSGGNGTGTATWQWLRNDAVISSTNSRTYIVVTADLGTTLKAQISYSNQIGNVTSTATRTVINPYLTGTVTINNMLPTVGDTLTATYSGNGTGTAAWQWRRDGRITISGANSSTYTVVAEDLGTRLDVRVSYSNQSSSITSMSTLAVNNPTLTGTVTINNMLPTVGDTLTATYSGNGTGTATWEWLRGDTVITGATGSTYKVDQSLLGYALKARVIYSNQSGSITSAETNKVTRLYNYKITNVSGAVNDTIKQVTGGNISSQWGSYVNDTIQNIIDLIQRDAEGKDCTIHFGDDNNGLNISDSLINFNNTNRTWGKITLTGTCMESTIIITDNVSIEANFYGGTIRHIGTGTVIVSGGRLSSAFGSTIDNTGSGSVIVNGGMVSSTSASSSSSAINNAGGGSVIISGGTVSSTSGYAINSSSSGRITVTGSAIVTSAQRSDPRGGTIYISKGEYGSTADTLLEVTGGTVRNTSNAGDAIHIFLNYPGSGSEFGKTIISGGRVEAAAGRAIYAMYYGSERYDAPLVSISGTAEVISANTSISQGGTIYFGYNNSNIGTWLEISGGMVSNTSSTGDAITTGNTPVMVSGGTISANNNSISATSGSVTLSGNPSITKTIKITPGCLSVMPESFVPGNRVYSLSLSSYTNLPVVAVRNGASFLNNFTIDHTGVTLVVSGNDLMVVQK